MRKYLRILPYMIMVVAVVMILSCCRLIVTAGASMEPTYSTGDRLLCVRSFAPPSAGDVILFEKDGKLLVKRVAAEPGEVADLPNDELPAYDYWGSDIVPEGYLFVTGDNSPQSHDSRDPDFGLIPIEDVWGYVVFQF